MINFQLSLD